MDYADVLDFDRAVDLMRAGGQRPVNLAADELLDLYTWEAREAVLVAGWRPQEASRAALRKPLGADRTVGDVGGNRRRRSCVRCHRRQSRDERAHGGRS